MQAEQIKEREKKAAEGNADTVEKTDESIDEVHGDYNKQNEDDVLENKENAEVEVDELTPALSEGASGSNIGAFIDSENSQSNSSYMGMASIDNILNLYAYETPADSGDEAPPAAVKVTCNADDEAEKFESQFSELDDTPAICAMGSSSVLLVNASPKQYQATAPPAQATLGLLFTATPAPSASAISPAQPTFAQEEDVEESNVVKEWTEKQAEQIKEREEKAAEGNADTVEKTDESIDQVYNDYNKQNEDDVSENKENNDININGLTPVLSDSTTGLDAVSDEDNSEELGPIDDTSDVSPGQDFDMNSAKLMGLENDDKSYKAIQEIITKVAPWLNLNQTWGRQAIKRVNKSIDRVQDEVERSKEIQKPLLHYLDGWPYREMLQRRFVTLRKK